MNRYDAVRRVPPITFTTTNWPYVEVLRKALFDGKPVRINRGEWSGRAYVTDIKVQSPVDGLTTFTVTVRPTGAPSKITVDCTVHGGNYLAQTFETVLCANIRQELERELASTLTGQGPSFTITDDPEEKTMDPKKAKFYVGSPRAMRDGWAKTTLNAAIEHAKQLVEETDEDQFIVKVIRIVRKKPQPIVVEDVK